ncbi:MULTISPECIES: DIP1281 family NlpC/P60 protein [unclassified Corynebacterium]|uniref:DIP1281 family NlpC/P60 protein n=1 Tax=unclassified Corynebacterium TaxID=2624378 RepID=UPI0008A60638|nr:MULTISPECIES: NlpC/P60 family protein [unclassified Corynebacterium]OFL23242.1 hydrolase [Corynebacterium sp. HMSC062A03]OFQ34633.1 hydrolase [Corynebacterium sp. HMSC072D12]OFS38847.1 hydrolase [Corynebacterium sp. HMSC069E04]OFT66418.1 hydrolase [Corynebacterium sp. HMSC05D03]
MATTSSFGFRRFKAAFAAIATTAALSTASSLAPAVAEEPERLNIESLLSSDSPSIADLAGAIAQIEERIAQAEAEIGIQRETVNRALVDLNDARTKAAQARQGTATARQELDDAQADVADAQAKLDEVSRSAYRRANTSDAVSHAAGKDARSDMLERQSYLRSQSEKQQAIVSDLEKERTEKANKESQLRKTQQLAEERAEKAADAESAAREQLSASEASIEESAAEREDLLSQLSSLHKALNQAKGVDVVDSSSPETGKNVNDEALSPAGEAGTQDTTTAPADDSTESTPETDSVAAAGPSASEAKDPTLQSQRSAPSVSAEDMDALSSAASTVANDPNVQELSSTSTASSAEEEATSGGSGSSFDPSGIDAETVALGIGAVGTVASLVAASQPGHSNSLSQDEIDALVEGSSKLFALQGEGASIAEASDSASATSDEDTVESEVSGVLDPLDTTDSVTDKASESLGDASREAKIETVISRATSQVGVPYAWGGGDANGPTQGIRDGGVADSHGDYNKVGFDCSGLVLYAFAGVGISLPHYTGYQYQKGTKIAPSEMERGDLIFYGPSGNQHVAIYLGDGTMVEAPQSGQNVSITPVRQGGMAPYAVRLI